MRQHIAVAFQHDPQQAQRFFDQFEDWGWRVRRDVLAHELFFLTRNGTPNWERFLASLAAADDRFTLSETMPATVSRDMVRYLQDRIKELMPVDGGDPGAPPLPPFE